MASPYAKKNKKLQVHSKRKREREIGDSRNIKDPPVFARQRVEKDLRSVFPNLIRTNLTSTGDGAQFPPCIVWFWESILLISLRITRELLFLTHERTAGVEDFWTVRWIFVHNTTIAKFLDETIFSLNIGIGNIADFVRMESIPNVN